jgi:hypothetical protein
MTASYATLELKVQRRAHAMSALAKTMAGEYLNEIQREMMREHKWSFFETNQHAITMVANTAYVAIPADNRRIQLVFLKDSDGSFFELEQLDDEDYNVRVNSTDRGEPRFYRISQGRIYLGPIPNAAAVTKYASVYIQYVAYPDDIDGSHASGWPTSDYDDCLVLGAAARLAQTHGDQSQAGTLDGLYRKNLLDLRRQDSTDKGKPRLRVTSTMNLQHKRVKSDYGRFV